VNRRIYSCAIIVAVMAVVGACRGPSRPSAEESGITGIVVAGPQCPVEVIGHTCPPRPVSATITVTDQSGKTISTFRSTPDGQFRVRLAPGTYRLVTVQANQPQLLHPVAVTVAYRRYTQLRLFLDTGIR